MNNPDTSPDTTPATPEHPLQAGFRTTLIGIVASILLAAGKATAGIAGHSSALLADAIESTGDIFTTIIMYLGLKKATKPPDEDHPWGHGKAEPISALVVVAILVTAAVAIIIGSIRNVPVRQHPPESYTLLVLGLVIVIKWLLSRYFSRIGTDIESSAVQAEALHHRSDALTSAAAFIGISVALTGGEGYEIADDIAALVAALIILYNAWHIGRPALGELMDEQPDPEWLHKVEEVAMAHPEVKSIEKVRLRKLGFDLYIDFHLRVDPALSVEEGHRVSHEVKDELTGLHPYIRDVLIHIEPEAENPDY